ncbi:class I SAM-dependent methyltransferase [Thermoplasma sp. Kam2015]|uniref:class I SAM-dependent methyltransferase n=1 Tax=Thermoplasma sp. Kam2015 TaxID=2094122 RepID=UPI000D8F63D1|nr:class I SAM-dependent methyltransferase [Thermoplasma sp. Kam2015]PYB69013.1 class I SAM-dependent methyltransferase [Thermoplasma sp. Kam2015]
MDLYKEGEERFGFLSSHFYGIISNHFLRDLYMLIVEDIGKYNPSTILDVGCGTGSADYFIASNYPNISIDCIDPSPYMISIAKKKLSRFDGRVNLQLGSSRSIPFDRKYDFIFTSISFHHWKCREDGLRNMAKYANEKGVVAVYEYYRPNLRGFHKAAGKHALTMDEVQAINLDGFRKTFEIKGEMMRILFQKI